VTQVAETELFAYWYNGLDPGEKSNCIEQLWGRIVACITLIRVILVSTVPRNLVGSAALLTVVPSTSAQLTETLSLGGALNCLACACQSYVILHIRVTSRPLMAG